MTGTGKKPPIDTGSLLPSIKAATKAAGAFGTSMKEAAKAAHDFNEAVGKLSFIEPSIRIVESSSSTNPCGEVPLRAAESCALGAEWDVHVWKKPLEPNDWEFDVIGLELHPIAITELHRDLEEMLLFEPNMDADDIRQAIKDRIAHQLRPTRFTIEEAERYNDRYDSFEKKRKPEKDAFDRIARGELLTSDDEGVVIGFDPAAGGDSNALVIGRAKADGTFIIDETMLWKSGEEPPKFAREFLCEPPEPPPEDFTTRGRRERPEPRCMADDEGDCIYHKRGDPDCLRTKLVHD